MNSRIIKNFDRFNESMKLAKDLNKNTGLFISDEELTLTLFDTKEEIVYGYIGLSQNIENTYYLPVVAAESGYGPLIFEFGMMYTHPNSLMISRDGDIRGEAFEVWGKFYNREDIIKKTLDFDDDDYNFAIITGEEHFENSMAKQVEYEFHVNDGFKKDIEIYNTGMSIKPTSNYYKLIDIAKKSGFDNSVISDKGHDFFSWRYSE